MSLKERLERLEVEERVKIPTLDGSAVVETVTVKVPAWRDPKDNGIYLEGEATALLDRVKARHLGLLTPQEIKRLRQQLRHPQREISALLGAGPVPLDQRAATPALCPENTGETPGT